MNYIVEAYNELLTDHLIECSLPHLSKGFKLEETPSVMYAYYKITYSDKNINLDVPLLYFKKPLTALDIPEIEKEVKAAFNEIDGYFVPERLIQILWG